MSNFESPPLIGLVHAEGHRIARRPAGFVLTPPIRLDSCSSGAHHLLGRLGARP
jgi:hypothetical protein